MNPLQTIEDICIMKSKTTSSFVTLMFAESKQRV